MIEKLIKFFGFNRERIVHNYTKRYWGHDYGIREVVGYGKELKLYGWGSGLKTGHCLLLEKEGDFAGTQYRIKDIRYELNPTDMWWVTAVYVPRTQQQKAADVERFNLAKERLFALPEAK